MNRTLTAAVAALAIGGVTLTACGDDERTAQAVCVDRVTEVRVDDWQCDQNNSNPNYMLWYLAAGQGMFNYGQRAPYGSAVVPQGYRTPSYTPSRPPTTPSTVTTAVPPTSTSKAPTTSSKPSTSSSKPSTPSSKPSTQSKPSSKAPAAPKPKPAAPKPARPR